MNSTNHSLTSPENFCLYKYLIIYDEYVVSDYFFTVLAIIINLLTCPFIVLLNTLVIIAIKTKARLQTPHNFLLACLVVTDLMVGIGAQPAFIIQRIVLLFRGSSTLACSLDNLIQLIILCLCLVSVLHLAIISVERFVAIRYPFRYEDIVNTFRLTLALGCCWLFIGLYFIFRILRLRVFPPSITLIVSFPVIIYCHTYVYFVCRRHENQIQSEQVSQEATAKFLKEKKAWKTTSIIIGGLFMCYFPGFVISIIPEIFPGFLIRRLFVSSRPLCFSFYLLNSLCNPIIYCWRSQEIRQALKQLLRLPSNGGHN